MIAERENQQLREKTTDLEHSVALLKTENETLKAQVAELGEGGRTYDQRIQDELDKQRANH